MAWHGDYVKDAFLYLELDHRKLAALLRQLSGGESQATKERIAEEVSRALVLHIDLVEGLVYPTLRQGGAIHDRLVEGYSEHQILRLLVNELALMRVGTEEWAAKVAALAENMRQHTVAEEALIKSARDILSIRTVRQITDAMQSMLNALPINRAFIAPRA